MWGLSCSDARGVDVRHGQNSAEYVAKFGTDADPESQPASSTWGVDSELTKLHSKNGKTQSITPFDFLRIMSLSDISSDVREEAKRLWLEFVRATKGRVQLMYSRGLKQMYDEPDLDSFEESEVEVASLLSAIPATLWREIVKSKRRADVLSFAELYIKSKGGFSSVELLHPSNDVVVYHKDVAYHVVSRDNFIEELSKFLRASA